MTFTREAALVAYRAFSDVAGKGAFFLITLLAARALTPREFGIFALGTTAGWIAAVAADFGIQLHLARAVARRPHAAPALLGTWLRVRCATAAAVLAVAGAALAAADATASTVAAMLLFVLVYLVGGLVEFLHYFYRGLSRSDVESTLTLSHRFAMLAAAAAVLQWRPGPIALATAMLVPGAGTLLYSLRRATRMARELAAGSSAAIEPADVRVRFMDVAPIGAGIVLSALYFRVDVFLIELWNGTEAVASYNAVFRLVEALRLFPAAVLAVALPTLFRATSTRPLLGVSAVVTTFSVGVALVLWAAAPRLVPLLYGPAYAGAVPAFRILLAALPLMSLNYAMTHQLVGWNRHRAYAAVCAAALVFNVALNAWLIPLLAIEGAAWSTIATEALVTLGCLVALRSRTPRPSREVFPAPVSS